MTKIKKEYEKIEKYDLIYIKEKWIPVTPDLIGEFVEKSFVKPPSLGERYEIQSFFDILLL